MMQYSHNGNKIKMFYMELSVVSNGYNGMPVEVNSLNLYTKFWHGSADSIVFLALLTHAISQRRCGRFVRNI